MSKEEVPETLGCIPAGDRERLPVGDGPSVVAKGLTGLKTEAGEGSKPGKVNQLNQLIRPVTP